MKREITTQAPDINPEPHEARACDIAASIGLTVVAAFKGDRCPPWANGQELRNACRKCYTIHGDRYRVTLRFDIPKPGSGIGQTTRATLDGPKPEPGLRDGRHWETRPRSFSFDFWASKHDKETGKRPGYYDVLGCVASDAFMPTNPDEVVEELGDMKPSQAIAVAKHAARLQAFFTESELTALEEIR